MKVEQTLFQQFLDGLEGQLKDLPFPNQLAFAVSCCERAFPNYVEFSRRHGWRSADALRLALDEAWEIVEGQEKSELTNVKERCEAATPKSDDFPGEDVTAAQEAAFMVTLLLEFCLLRQPNYVKRIAAFARDTVDLYIQLEEGLHPSDPDLEEKIANHPLMQQELQTMKTELEMLKRIRLREELRNFKLRASNPATSNIGLGLTEL
jgi:uncharacterized protein YjaG (DUF416 family)